MTHGRVAFALVLACALACVPASPARAENVKLSVDKYSPDLPDAVVQRYKGVHLYLKEFSNEAENTGLWSYRSTDKKVYIKTSHNLNSFLWRCFEKAAIKAGTIVYRDSSAAPEVPALEIVFTSWTLERFVANVSLMKNGKKVYQKQRDLQLPARSGPAMASDQVAYAGIDAIISQILMEPEFQAAFFGNSTAP
jgi:hypothetical protein